jgi:drug/metabolite transporter (DMT)-like permease
MQYYGLFAAPSTAYRLRRQEAFEGSTIMSVTTLRSSPQGSGKSTHRAAEAAQNCSAGSSYRAWGIAFALTGVLAFSLRPIWIKLAYAVPTPTGTVSPITLLFLRLMLALPFFIVIAFLRRGKEPRLGARDWWAVAGLGFVGFYMASLFDFVGLQYVGAGLGRLILFLYPTLVLLLSFLFLNKPPSLREISAMVVGYVGIALVLSNSIGLQVESASVLFGATLIFASALCFAVYLVAGGQMVKRIGSMRFTAYTMIASTVPAALQFFTLEPLSALRLPAGLWTYAVILAVFSTILPVLLQAEALKRIGANHFALIGAAGPVVTAAAGTFGLEEPFTLLQMAGGMLVIVGVLVVSMKPN